MTMMDEARGAGAGNGGALLEELGTTVRRPGGRAMTGWLLSHAGVDGVDVVELVPGHGTTAAMILARDPRSYVGVEPDPDRARGADAAMGSAGRVVAGDPAATGLAEGAADVVVAESAMTDLSDRAKAAVLAEAARLLRPGGLLALHELHLGKGDGGAGAAGSAGSAADSPAARDHRVRAELARLLGVNSRPLSAAGWRALAEDAGFALVEERREPVAMLTPRRILADEGPLRAARIAAGILRDAGTRRRVAGIRSLAADPEVDLGSVAMVLRRA